MQFLSSDDGNGGNNVDVILSITDGASSDTLHFINYHGQLNGDLIGELSFVSWTLEHPELTQKEPRKGTNKRAK